MIQWLKLARRYPGQLVLLVFCHLSTSSMLTGLLRQSIQLDKICEGYVSNISDTLSVSLLYLEL